MLYTFCRNGRQLHYEVHLAADGAGYDLIVKHPDRKEVAEKFDDLASLNRRTLELQQQLLADGWWVAGLSRR